MNAPERFLTWRWEDEQDTKKVTYLPDTKRANCGTFILGKEDHTLGNLLRMQLLRDNEVRFAGYKMPHPLVFDCHVKVETMSGATNPIKVVGAALEDLKVEIDILESQFKEAADYYERQNM